ncbi:type II toxin-antitoxin system Phd/YefM family antitoxin [Eoetvoesiella caeni]
MRVWPVQDAKARFSEFLDACLSDGPQMVTRRGNEAAVLVPVAEWRRLQAAAQPSLKELVLSDVARTDYLVPSRGKGRRRRLEPIRSVAR